MLLYIFLASSSDSAIGGIVASTVAGIIVFGAIGLYNHFKTKK